MREGLLTGLGARKPGRVLSGEAFSRPVNRAGSGSGNQSPDIEGFCVAAQAQPLGKPYPWRTELASNFVGAQGT
jgi:hypothetical protein